MGLKGENRMAERQGETLAMLAEETMVHPVEAHGRNGYQSSFEWLPWYFAQPAIPELVYVATINGYVAGDRDKTKGGKENV
jgi:hypothetical protein